MLSLRPNTKQIKVCTTFLCAFLCTISALLHAQVLRTTNDLIPHHILDHTELLYMEDTTRRLTFLQASSIPLQEQYKEVKKYRMNSPYATHWYKFRIKKNPQTRTNWVFEVFDQTIQDITIYSPDPSGTFQAQRFGTNHRFTDRPFSHKNFVISIDDRSTTEFSYYVRINSTRPFTALFVLRELKWFVGYAINEYLAFGLFYGMTLVFSMYNLLMFLALKDRKYLYYILYNISIALYEMCNDGLAFQYVWPGWPGLNIYADGFFLWFSVFAGLLFTHEFLGLKHRAPLLSKVVWWMIGVRTLYFIIALGYPVLFDVKAIEIFPLLLALTAGITVYMEGFRPSRFLIIGYSILLLGVVIKTLLYFDLRWMPNGPATHYSLSFAIIIEMVFVSFGIGDSIRTLRNKKERTQRRMIDQLRINEKLQQTMNNELSVLVEERTKALSEKTALVESQHQEILKMNQLLQKDNEVLSTDIQTIRKARVMTDEVNFEEFSRIYPDKETCFKYLSELKWSGGYVCKKCGNTQYLAGLSPYSRRCTKCGYDESVLAYTIFHNSRIPINKAFYILFLVYVSKGKISSYELSKQLDIRQSTCWTYNSKMQNVLHERAALIAKAGKSGWSLLILDSLKPSITSLTARHEK